MRPATILECNTGFCAVGTTLAALRIECTLRASTQVAGLRGRTQLRLLELEASVCPVWIATFTGHWSEKQLFWHWAAIILSSFRTNENGTISGVSRKTKGVYFWRAAIACHIGSSDFDRGCPSTAINSDISGPCCRAGTFGVCWARAVFQMASPHSGAFKAGLSRTIFACIMAATMACFSYFFPEYDPFWYEQAEIERTIEPALSAINKERDGGSQLDNQERPALSRRLFRFRGDQAPQLPNQYPRPCSS